MTGRGYPSSGRRASDLPRPPKGRAPGATRVNRPPGDERQPDWYPVEPVSTQPAPEVNVTDPLPDSVLYGPRGEELSRLSNRNPIGFR